MIAVLFRAEVRCAGCGLPPSRVCRNRDGMVRVTGGHRLRRYVPRWVAGLVVPGV